MAEMTQKHLYLWRSPRKAQTQNKKIFSILTTRVVASVEGLNSSLALVVGELWPKECWPRSWPFRNVKGVEELC